MSQTQLSYTKQIWKVFSVAIMFSVAVLSCFYLGLLRYWSLAALSLSFAFFVYSCFLILHYNFKKEKFREIVQKFSFLDRSYLLERELSLNLDKVYHPRINWIAEVVLLLGVFVYIYAFSKTGIYYVLIPVLILCYAVLIHLYNNKRVLERSHKF